jgi:hypothetical protein
LTWQGSTGSSQKKLHHYPLCRDPRLAYYDNNLAATSRTVLIEAATAATYDILIRCAVPTPSGFLLQCNYYENFLNPARN